MPYYTSNFRSIFNQSSLTKLKLQPSGFCNSNSTSTKDLPKEEDTNIQRNPLLSSFIWKTADAKSHRR